MPLLAPGDANCMWFFSFRCFFCIHQFDFILSCAAGVLRIQMSSECSSSEPEGLVERVVAVWPLAFEIALTQFFKMTPEGGTSHQMHHSLIKSWCLLRLMGLRADIQGCTSCLSNCLLLSLPQWSTLLYPILPQKKRRSKNLHCRLQQDKLPWFT